MSDSKFTPGPWFWEYSQDSDGPIALSAGRTDVLLATGAFGRAWAEVGDADARLIASAPDLLAACEAAGPLLLLLGAKTDWPAEVKVTLEAMRAAVARAKGIRE